MENNKSGKADAIPTTSLVKQAAALTEIANRSGLT